MIKFMIKTLDSNNHHFCVDDETTVAQLKQEVYEKLKIDINLQRLIFCGRVLQDDKKLSDYNVNDKVIHLVQRAPPSPSGPRESSRHSASPLSNNDVNPSTPPNRIIPHHGLFSMFGAMGPEEQRNMSAMPTTGRMEFIKRMIAEIKMSLASLATHVNSENAAGASSRPSTGNATGAAGAAAAATTSSSGNESRPAETVEEPTENIGPSSIRRRISRARTLRNRSRPRDLADLIEDLDQLQLQFTPFRNTYVRMLRAVHTLDPPRYTEEGRQNAQRTVDLVSDILHSFAHAYHALSDIEFQVDHRNSRLVSDGSLIRHPIPMQAHINVIRQHHAPAESMGGSRHGATTAPQNATPAREHSPGSHSNQPGRNPTQPSVNINIQPDPVAYQVEIETRVPIAFALDNAIFNGLRNVGTDNPAASSDSTQQPTQGNEQANPSNQNQSQANRRQVLFDFENLFRGLSQQGTLGGVEVVMSMEEITQAGVLGPLAGSGTATNTSNGSTVTSQNGENGVFISPMQWGGAPSADLLQNIVSSVIRQGLVPGVEGVTLHTHHGHAHGQMPQGQAPTPSSRGNGPSHQPTATETRTGGAHEGGDNPEPRQPNIRRVPNTPRAQAISLSSIIYDRYLPCDSVHARRRLQRRREHRLQQLAAQDRARVIRVAMQNIEYLRERCPNLTQENVQTITRIINTVPPYDSWINGILITIARHLFMSDLARSTPGEPANIPNEFNRIRELFRTFLGRYVNTVGLEDIFEACDAVAGALIDMNIAFLSRMTMITEIRPDIDLIESLRSLLRTRLPAIATSVMSDLSETSYPNHFYAAFVRLFTELCALLGYCCLDGEAGVRRILNCFIEYLVRPCEPCVRETFLALHANNLDSVLANMGGPETIIQYIQRQVPDDEPVSVEMAMDIDPPSVDIWAHDTSSNDGSPWSTPSPTPMAGEEVAGPAPPSAEPSTSTAPATVEALPIKIPVSATFSSKSKKEDKNKTDSGSGSSSQRVSPPMIIVEHWGEEWMPVFARDQQLQNDREESTREPYSDAYLTGMPSRKRRRIIDSRPPASVDALLDETVTELSNQPARAGDRLRAAFREHMLNIARTRTFTSEDFDTTQFASIARFLNMLRTNQHQGENSNSDKNKNTNA